MSGHCIYCDKDENLVKIMLPICEVDGYPLYLMKNQAYRGRVVLAYDEHIGTIAQMPEDKCEAFFNAVRKVCMVLEELFAPGQINIGMYADKMSHLHCHIVPKYPDSLDWGNVFTMNPEPQTILAEEKYADMIEKIRVAIEQKCG